MVTVFLPCVTCHLPFGCYCLLSCFGYKNEPSRVLRGDEHTLLAGAAFLTGRETTIKSTMLHIRA